MQVYNNHVTLHILFPLHLKLTSGPTYSYKEPREGCFELKDALFQENCHFVHV